MNIFQFMPNQTMIEMQEKPWRPHGRNILDAREMDQI